LTEIFIPNLMEAPEGGSIQNAKRTL